MNLTGLVDGYDLKYGHTLTYWLSLIDGYDLTDRVTVYWTGTDSVTVHHSLLAVRN